MYDEVRTDVGDAWVGRVLKIDVLPQNPNIRMQSLDFMQVLQSNKDLQLPAASDSERSML